MADDFLTRFEKNRRSLIANQFCFAVREGCQAPDEVLAWVKYDAEKRLSKPYSPDQKPSQRLLLSVLDLPEAWEFARFVIEREKLPPEIRQRQKEEQAQKYQREYMARQLPTEKQLAYLKALGVAETPKTRLEASELIEEAQIRKAYGNLQR